jgi:hypothetical protein
MKGCKIGLILLALTLASSASATDLALWPFEVILPQTGLAGPYAPDSGAYSQTGVSEARGAHPATDPNSGYGSVTGNGSAHALSSNSWAVGDYYQFKTRTLGYTGVTVDWDQTSSNTGPRDFVLQYSTDGTTFTTFGSAYVVLANGAPNTPWTSTPPPNPAFHYSVNLNTVTALNNVSAIYVRLTDNSTVSANGGVVAAGGTDRVDNVRVAATAMAATGACCISGSCTAGMSPDACAAAGGQYMGNGQPCATCPVVPTGACCVSTACSIQTQAGCASAAGVYKGDGTVCSPNPCLFDMTIGQAKSYPPGTPLRIANVIVSSTQDLVNSASYKTLHVQDATGGVTVWGTNAVIDALLATPLVEGDQTTLEGTISMYNCLAEFVAPYNTPSVLAHPGVTPIVVHASDFADGSFTAEALESTLVRVNCLSITATGNWAYNTYTATDSTGALAIRIATTAIPLVGTAIPTGSFDMIGIFSQFDTGGTCVTGYQLQPRYLTDQILSNCPIVGACCVGATCSTTTQADCATAQGTWGGKGTTCTPNPCVGACCTNGACSLTLAAACTTPSIFLGNGSECLVAVCPTPVHSGDLALGLSDGRAWVTAEQIRHDPNNSAVGYQVGAWSSKAFLQSMEFDNLGGLQHNRAGNLLGADNGAGGGTAGSAPSCTDPNRPQEGAKLYSLATDGSNGGQLLWDFNSLASNPNPNSAECTRGGGLSVSPDNQYIAFWGSDTKHLYVLRYHAGTGGGSGGSISNEYIYTGLVATASTGTIGTTWYNSSTILVLCTSTVPGTSKLYSVDFNAGVFSNLVLRTTLYHGAGTASLFTDVEYNPTVSPYVYCQFSSLTTSVSYTYLDVVDPANWSIFKQISIGANYLDPNSPVASCNTGREIALGPDGYLYISQYAGAGVPRPYVDRIDTANVGSWTDDSTADYYVVSSSPVYSPYNGLDVAFGAPGACCVGTSCIGEFYEQVCVAYGGTFKGEGVLCSSNPCNPTGACCTPAGACSLTTQSNCITPNTWQGAGTNCTPNNCPPPVATGACCSATGTCSVITQAACGTGHYYGDGTSCRAPGNRCPASCKGDMNCDGRVTFADIDPFVAALSGESVWTHWPCPWYNANCNADTVVTFADIDPFVAVIGTTCLP